MPGHALEKFKSSDRVLIVVSDSFRTTGIEKVLPTLIVALNSKGIPDANIRFIYSTGSHRGPTPTEEQHILGEAVYSRFKEQTITHNPEDTNRLQYCGETSRGTPVYLNRFLFEADQIITTGTVVYHYFGGFGGGRKSLVPGLAGLSTIAHNHALNLDPVIDRIDPLVKIGDMDANPVALDMMEAARFAPCSFIINTVLNRSGDISELFVGDLETAHRHAADFAQQCYGVPLSKKADFVIASAGNARNYIQSHKALFNASQVIKLNGRILFLAPAPEGYGGHGFEKWVHLGSAEAIMKQLRTQAEINGQTALSTLQRAPQAWFITEMNCDQVKLLGGVKADSLDTALQACQIFFERIGNHNPTYYIMPSAAYTVPVWGI